MESANICPRDLIVEARKADLRDATYLTTDAESVISCSYCPSAVKIGVDGQAELPACERLSTDLVSRLLALNAQLNATA